MDARIDVFGILGLDVGDAHVVRNAGGRANDALRSVVISQQLLGTREIIILHHVRLLLHQTHGMIANLSIDRLWYAHFLRQRHSFQDRQ